MTCRTAVRILTSVVAVLTSVVAAGGPIAAQNPAGAKGDITVTGCLQRGIDGKFVIANADVPAGDDRLTRVDPTGASDVMPSKVTQSWWLQGAGDFEKNVGRRIEVTGREPATQASSGKATPGAVGTSGTTATVQNPVETKDDAHNARRLEVKAVKVLPGSCS